MPTVRVWLTVLAASVGCTRDHAPAAPTAHAPPPSVPVVAEVEGPRTADHHPEAMKEPDENVIAAMGMQVTFIDPGAAELEPVDAAIAVLRPTHGNEVAGTLTFREVNGGLDVVASLTGLPRARHAIHVHLFGDCASQDASSTGPHFNFAGSSYRPRGDQIVGDLGDVDATRGVSTTALRIEGASLQGRFSVLGRSVVVHARPNDRARAPEGGVGARLACGVIGLTLAPTSEEQLAGATR